MKKSGQKSDNGLNYGKYAGISDSFVREVAFLCTDGVNNESVIHLKSALENSGAKVQILAPHMGYIKTDEGDEIRVDQNLLFAALGLYDAVYIPSGSGIASLQNIPQVSNIIMDAYKHSRLIGAEGEGTIVFDAAHIPVNPSKLNKPDSTILLNPENTDQGFTNLFVKAMGRRYL